VVHPEGDRPRDYDESYRLARYASYAHWQDTRRPSGMMGDGPLAALGAEGGEIRRRYLMDSDGAYFLVGSMAPDVPLYFPALDEQYELAEDAAPAVHEVRPVRYDIPIPGDPIITLEYNRIPKGTFLRFLTLSRDGMWPLMSKMGARVIGQWRIVHPPEPARSITQSGDFDEVLTMTRFASHQHCEAAREPAELIGDGPDCQSFKAALAERLHLVSAGLTRFLSGDLYGSPPTYIPPLAEHYRQVRDTDRKNSA
jgi:hypothetical protein